jgi:tetratricopeptide (TPR) repeat protein
VTWTGCARDLAAAAEQFRQAGERWGRATSLTYLAYIRIMLGHFDDAIVALEEAIRLLRELDPTDDAVMQRAGIADARRRKGDVGRARAELLEMVAPGSGRPTVRYLIFARIALGDLARDDGDLRDAARQYDAAADDLSRVPFNAPLFRAMLGSAMGHLAVARGELGAAQRCLAEAVALAVEAPDMPLVAIVGVGVARLCLRRRAVHAAAQVLGAAHALRGVPDAFNPDVVRLVQELRRELGERAYHAAYAHGRGLDRTDAVALIEVQVRRR